MACRTGGSRTSARPGGPPGATCRWPPPTRSNGHRAGSTSRCSARSCPPASSASIMSRSRSRRCRAKLKTSFDPVLGPVITRKIAAGDRSGRQAGAAGRPTGSSPRRSGSRSRSAFPGEAVMGLVGRGIRRRHRDARPSCSPPKWSRDGRGRQRGGADLCRAPPQHDDQPGRCSRSRRGWRWH